MAAHAIESVEGFNSELWDSLASAFNALASYQHASITFVYLRRNRAKMKTTTFFHDHNIHILKKLFDILSRFPKRRSCTFYNMTIKLQTVVQIYLTKSFFHFRWFFILHRRFANAYNATEATIEDKAGERKKNEKKNETEFKTD